MLALLQIWFQTTREVGCKCHGLLGSMGGIFVHPFGLEHKVTDTLCLKTVHRVEFEDGDEQQYLR